MEGKSLGDLEAEAIIRAAAQRLKLIVQLKVLF